LEPIYMYFVPGQSIMNTLITPVISVDADTRKKILSVGFAKYNMRKSAAISSESLQKYTKVLVFCHVGTVLSVVLCSREKWTVLNKHMKQLQAFQVKCLLSTCGYTLSDRQHMGPIMNEPADKPTILSKLPFEMTQLTRTLGHMTDLRLP